MNSELTKIQKKILEFIIEEINNRIPPTLSEIAEHFKYKNRSTIRQHLQAIEKKGFIKRTCGKSRGIELNTQENIFVKRTIIGEVAAGTPLIIYNDAIDTIDLPATVNIPKKSFLLKVKGESLKDAYIFDGDVIIVNPTIKPKTGNFVVAVIEDAAVVKRFKKNRSKIELISENKDYKPIIIDKNHSGFRLIGVVTGIYRSMNN